MRDISATKKFLEAGWTHEEIKHWAVGLRMRNEPSHSRLIEELEGGGKKITHWRGDDNWVTYEEGK